MINNKGPIIDPCGTPIVKGKISDLLSSISVYCRGSYDKDYLTFRPN